MMMLRAVNPSAQALQFIKPYILIINLNSKCKLDARRFDKHYVSSNATIMKEARENMFEL